MPKDRSKTLSDDESSNRGGVATKPSTRKKRTKYVKMELGSPEIPIFFNPIPVQEKVWWDKWQENQFIRSLFYDQDDQYANMMPFQKVSEATAVFNKNRTWPLPETQVRNRWDQFQVFAGLLENAAGDDFARLSNFVQDPARAVQTYLSSYFIEKGLHFSKYNCDIIPKLLFFYINFLLVNCILPDKQDNLQRAIDIIETAKTELALFSKIGETCPDHFNRACKQFFNRSSDVRSGFSTPLTPAPTLETNAQINVNVAGVDDPVLKSSSKKTKKKRKSEGKGENDTPRISTENTSTPDPLIEAPIDKQTTISGISWGDDAQARDRWGTDSRSDWGSDAANPPGSGWGSASGATTTNTWGSSTTVDGGDSATWTSAKDAGEDSGWGNFRVSPPPSSFLLPHISNALPKTHVRGVVEYSIRRIKAIVPPVDQKQSRIKVEDDLVVVDPKELEEELRRCYWTVVLEPWPMNSASVETQPHAFATTTNPDMPCILSGSKGSVDLVEASDLIYVEKGSVNDLSVGTVMPHNCLRDQITVFVEDESRQCLKVGMGLGGTWAQLLRISDCVGSEGRDGDSGTKVSGEGDIASETVSSHETRYWYMEEMLKTWPSYYIA